MKRILTLLIVAAAFFLMSPPVGAQENGVFPPVLGEMKKHTVKAGEDLYTIGLLYHVAIDHLMAANGISTLQVRPGTVLTVPSMRVVPAFLDNGIVLNLPERMLYLFNSKRLVARYPVAIGATGKWMTPVGDIRIVNMARNPTWLPPEWAGREDPVAPGPENPLGDRWIGLSLPGYGIHATNSPTSIGLAASHGCIRMVPRDAEALFDKVSVGMAVKIIYEPLLIGQAPDTKIIYLSSYPDIYGKVPDLKVLLAQKLEKYGIESLVDIARAESLAAAKKGIPEPVLGSAIQLRIQEHTVPLSLPIIARDGKYLVTSEFLEPLGAVIRWDDMLKTVEVSRNDRKISFRCGDDENSVLLWRGKTLLPLREVVEGLGLSLEWNGAQRSISILGASFRKPAVQVENQSASGERKYEDRVRSVEERF